MRKSLHETAGRTVAGAPAFEPMEPRLLLESHPIINEFLTISTNPVYLDNPDSDWDWIEIYNPTDTAVSLTGWHLTDSRANLTKWTFPTGVTIGAGEYKVVYASGLTGDPAHPSDLHACFKLDGDDPEYLGLILPGATPTVDDIVSEYYPRYPKQIANVSYGLGEPVTVGTSLVGEGSPLRVLVPDGEPDAAWAGSGAFDDSSWATGHTSVGYETGEAVTPTTVRINMQPSGSPIPEGYLMDSGNPFGDRGNGYSYGWNVTNNNTRDRGVHPDQRYDTLNHMQKSPGLYWEIALPSGTYDVVALFGDPSNTDQINTMDIEGTIRVDPDGYDNFDLYALTVTVTDGRLTVTPAVADGSVNAKFCYIDITAASEPTYENYIWTDLVADMPDQAASAYVRYTFSVENPLDFDSLVLRMRYDDGFAAYVNGTLVAERNAPPSPVYTSTALQDRTGWDAITFEEIDVSAYLGALVPGLNILAIHGLNVTLADDPDFLIQPELLADTTPARQELYFTTPTRGSANVPGSLGLVADTQFDHDRGFYDEPFAVTITTATPGAAIYYTTDGSKPQAIVEHRYTGPIAITTTTTLRAMAHKPGYLSTNVDTQTYVFPADVVHQATDPVTGAQVIPDGWPAIWGIGSNLIDADYQVDPRIVDDVDADMNAFDLIDALLAIPTLSVVLKQSDFLGAGGVGIYHGGANNLVYEVGCSLELLNPDGSSGFQIDCGIEIQGGTSNEGWKMEKLSFQIKFKEPWGPTKLVYDFFDDAGATDSFDTLILDARMNQSWAYAGGSSPDYQRLHAQYTRDQYAPDVQNAMGGFAPYGKQVQLYVNGMYWGLYSVHERPDEKFAAAYMGGDREDWYVIKNTTSYVVINGGAAADADFKGLFTLANSGLANNANYLAMGERLDAPGFVDYIIANFYAANDDWAHHNWYTTRNAADPDGRWRFHAWDSEHTLKGETANVTGNNPGEWTPTHLHQHLMENAEYRMLFADHVHQYFFNGGLLTPGGATALYQRRIDEIDRAVMAESARWGDNQRPADPYMREDEWLTELDRLVNVYFPGRSDTMIRIVSGEPTGQFRSANLYPSVVAPTFSQHGGAIASGYALTMSVPVQEPGTIYYTLNGTDPRAWGGGLAPGALVYNPASPPVLTADTLVKSRTRDGTNWSALNEATFVVPGTLPAVRITEIMYNPAPPDSTPGDPEAPFPYNESFEYIELRNVGATAVNLAGLRLSNGVEFTFPSMTVPAGGYVLVVKSKAAFQARYGTGCTIAGEYGAGSFLANDGERIELSTTLGEVIQTFEYKDGWFDHTDGQGYSLVVRNPTQALDLWDSKDGWRASWTTGGNPGAADTGYDPGSIVINEVVAHSNFAPQDWVELYNTTGSPITITGWFLSDDTADLMKYQIGQAAPVIIPAYGYKAFTELYNFGASAADPGRSVGFALSELGDQVYLTSSPDGAALGGYREDEQFGASDPDVSFGRYVKSTGAKDFVQVLGQTFEGPNAAPLVPDVVINEIMYHPVTGGLEFIELHNPGGTDVCLHDPAHPENTWQFTDGVTFTFPAGAVVLAGGYALVIGVDLAAFEAVYGDMTGVNVYGPWTGKLANEGERVEVSRPGNPEPGGFVPYVVAEKITYNDNDPWTRLPDGEGPSLIRLNGSAYGNDAANWAAGASGGTPGAANVPADSTPPTVPGDVVATPVADNEVLVTWTPSDDPDTGVRAYRIYRDGERIGESLTTVYTDTAAVPGVPYAYAVAAVNDDAVEGAASAPAAARILTISSILATDSTHLMITFTEPVTLASVQNVANYSILYGAGNTLAVQVATLLGDQVTAWVALASPITSGTLYAVKVAGITAQADTTTVLAGCQRTLRWWSAGAGTISREWWLGVTGEYVTQLTKDADYPAAPDGSGQLALFEAPSVWADNYGQRVYGYVVPTQTGNYTFWLASDNRAHLYLSTDENPANKRLIAYVVGYAASREWSKMPSQQSTPVYLNAGQRYYVEVVHKESTAADNLAVAWTLPAQTPSTPIPGTNLSPYVAPAGVTVGIEATDPDAAEAGPDAGQFTITRTGSTAGSLIVYYSAAGTAGPADYSEALPRWVELPDGVPSVTIDVTPVDDGVAETQEILILRLTESPAYALGAASAMVTILDNGVVPPTVEVLATDAAAAESGTDTGQFTVTRTGDLVGALTVYYTLGGTAGAGDYTPTLTGQVVIPDASDSAVITITPVDDGDQEPDETLILTLSPHASYTVGTGTEATVTILDNELPVVTAVVLNPNPLRTVRTVSQIEPSGIGVDTIRVTFNEAVTFTSANVVAEKVFVDESGNVSVTGTLTPTVGGSGTTEMSIQFANAWQNVIDTWVRIRLTGGVVDGDGHALDGEPRLDSSNLGYIYKATDDLPTGDGTAGGDAVFYVGSLRADMRGFGPFQPNPNGIVDQWDLNGFTSKYTQGNLDADFRGFGPFQPAPNGIVDQWDINGFTSAYTSALTQGKRLWPLPTAPEGMAPGGVLGSGELLSAPLASGDPVAVFAPETSILAADAAAPLESAPALASAGSQASAADAESDAADGAYAGVLTVASDEASEPAPAVWSPAASEPSSAGEAVDLLAGPALAVLLSA